METNIDNISSIYGTVPKENIISRMISRWIQFPMIAKVLSVLLLFSVIASGLYLSLVQKSQIAYIAPPTPATPPYVSAPPSPFPSAASCVSRVYSAEISYSCSRQGFFNFKIQCDDGRSFTIGDGRTCIDLMDAATQADQKCGIACNITLPSPRPSSSPTPPPGTCVSTLANIAYAAQAGACIKGGVQSANYICIDGFAGMLGDNKTCSDTAEYDALAKSRCGSPHTCQKPPTTPTPKPSVRPSMTPTPKPSFTPTPIPTTTSAPTGYPSPSVFPTRTPKPTTCINFLGRKICWPGIRPPLN